MNENSSNGKPIDARLPLQITLEAHEAFALSLVYERTPEDLDLWNDGADYSLSADSAMLKIQMAFAKARGDKELLLRGAALRARMDQIWGGS